MNREFKELGISENVILGLSKQDISLAYGHSRFGNYKNN